MKQKAQGSLEYLLLIGGAVVIAAVIVTLLLSLTGTSKGVSTNTAAQLEKQKFIAANQANIKLYLKMDGDFSDSSSGGTPYTATGATIASDGTRGQVGSFNGASYLTQAGSGAKLNYANNGFTYMTWINPTATPNSYNNIMSQLLPYFTIRSTREILFSLNAGGAQRALQPAGTTVPLNSWSHLAATYDASGVMKTYLNGKEIGTVGPFTPLFHYANDFYIGAWHDGVSPSSYFTGYIDEVIIVNYALSESQIKIFANA